LGSGEKSNPTGALPNCLIFAVRRNGDGLPRPVRSWMTKLGLTLNEVKTSLKNARQERFDFLGYSFGPHWYKANGKWYLGASPSKKSVQRLKTKVGNLLVPGNNEPWVEVRDTLNRSLRGWSNYFSYGTRRSVSRGIDRYVYERARLPR
jgi:RNA-directed DNA polymerase